MEKRHSLLRRQLASLAGGPEAVPEGLRALVEAVNDAYWQADEDRLMLERALERALELCSKELLEANAGLRAAKDAADEANLAKRRFLAKMSHELRTPLYAILGYGELVAEEVKSAPAVAAEIESILAAGRHLLELINGLLDFARIEAGRVEARLEDFDLDRLIDDVVSILRPLADRAGNRLVVEKPAPLGRLSSDPTMIRQILLNLLGNANKFTAKGVLTLSAVRDGGAGSGWVVLRVRDTGIGIPAEAQRRLFEPFVQLSPEPGRKYPGTGLGLAIARQYCEILGGSVAAESEPGRGSTFTVRLPDRTPAAPDLRRGGAMRAV